MLFYYQVVALVLLPYSQVQLSDQSLTSFAIQESGAVLGCGTADGSCHVLQLSAALVDMAQNEKQGINAMFERETLREKNLEKAQKEAKVKARREAARHAELADTITEEDLANIEKEFFKEAGLGGVEGLTAAKKAVAAPAARTGSATTDAHADADQH
eukprot:GHRR01023909.1.p2 GENE.GHRR01023909.1~~GHRR01023909.1.p2  ORF type:complete len:158 (+),score=72.51 GHRR01023909.1:484-957(+)